MALLKPCLSCGTPSVGTRCQRCTSAHRKAEGYNTLDYKTRRAAILLAEPWCHANPCRYPDDAGTADNPLTADHVVPIAKGGRDGPLVPMCMRDNSAKQARTSPIL